MKKLLVTGIALLCMVAVVSGLAGCYGVNNITGSQKLETREFANENFSRVDVSATIRVDITRSDTYAVKVTANDNLFDYIEVTQTGDTLRLRLKPFFSFRNTTVNAVITMPDLRALNLSGASSGELAGFQSGGATDITVSGASRLDIVSLQAQDLTMEISGASRANGFVEAGDGRFTVSGASNLELNGSADSARMDGSGASSLRMADFNILNATIGLSGASNASIQVNGKLDLELSGASRLTLGGNPTMGKVQISGASSLSRR